MNVLLFRLPVSLSALWLGMLMFLLPGIGWGSAESLATLEQVKAKIEAVKAKTGLDEQLKDRVLNAYYAAQDSLEQLESFDLEMTDLQKQLKSMPAEIKSLEKRVTTEQEAVDKKKQQKFSIYPTDELEKRLLIEKTAQNEFESAIQQLELKIAEQLKRPQLIREDISATKALQIQSQQEYDLLPSLLTNATELIARQTQLASRIAKLNVRLNKLDLENIVQPLRLQRDKLQLDLLNLQSHESEVLIQAIDEFLMQRRQQEINKTQQELIQAQKEAAGKHRVIQDVTYENIVYNRLLQETNTKLEQYIKRKGDLENLQKQLEKDYKSAEQKINLAGLSPALGNLLREQRRSLPSQADYQDNFNKIQSEIAWVSLKLFEFEETLTGLQDMEQALALRMKQVAIGDADEREHFRIRSELRVLLNYQKDLLVQLNGIYQTYSRSLADAEFALQQLVSLGEKFSQFLDKRLLWVPSAPVLDEHFPVELMRSISWFTAEEQWKRLGNSFQHNIQQHYFLATLSGLFVVLLVSMRPRFKRSLDELLKKSLKVYSDRFMNTFVGFFYVFLMSLPLPMLMVFSAFLLSADRMVTESFSHQVSSGLVLAAIPALVIHFFLQLFRPAGLAHVFFDWSEEHLNLIYRPLKKIRWLIILSVFLINMFQNEFYSEHSYSLGRAALMFLMLLFIYAMHVCFHPVKGLAKVYYEANPDGVLVRLRYLFYGIFMLLPVIVIGFAASGYYQSAVELHYKLIFLLRLAFFSVLLHAVVLRWLTLANRKMALKNARQRRKQLQERAGSQDAEASAVSMTLEEEALLDIPKINEQNRKLLSTVVIIMLGLGIWWNLRDLLPAFTIFDRFILWQHTVQVDGQASLEPVTLINVLLCFFYLVVMFVLVNNFPGLVDLLLVGNYGMSAGSRYALIQLTRYAVITLTVILVANELGGKWSQVQWLVAALGVGLGFGLQEIFANLVSGIILLFERPIRVGDTVTVGDLHGKVSHIQMRATTIVDWDQKELIIPNKTFITDKLVNWTLSDTITKVTIPVGISYEADEEQALVIFWQILQDIPTVLKDPEPQVFFTGLGESSLDFSLRVYVNNLSDRLPVVDEILRKIRKEFKQHGIEIPYPQRDIHIRSSV